MNNKNSKALCPFKQHTVRTKNTTKTVFGSCTDRCMAYNHGRCRKLEGERHEK